MGRFSLEFWIPSAIQGREIPRNESLVPKTPSRHQYQAEFQRPSSKFSISCKGISVVRTVDKRTRVVGGVGCVLEDGKGANDDYRRKWPSGPFPEQPLAVTTEHAFVTSGAIMNQTTAVLSHRAYLPPMLPDRPKKEQNRPSPSSQDPDASAPVKKPKLYNENPFDLLHLECFTFVMSSLGERGLTMCVRITPALLGLYLHLSPQMPMFSMPPRLS